MSATVMLAGASGLVGGSVLRRLLDAGERVLAPARRALGISAAALTELSLDPDHTQLPHLDAFMCCLGTTLAKAGSREAFLAVDHDLVIRLAKTARAAGCRHALLISSVGADPRSGNFYLKSKGQVEDALAQMGFSRLDILQPGLLLGDRNEPRRGEAIAQKLAPFYNPLLRLGLKRYRAISAGAVADAMVALLNARDAGVFRHTYSSLIQLSHD